MRSQVWLMATVKTRHSMNSVPGQKIFLFYSVPPWIMSPSPLENSFHAIKFNVPGHYLRKYGTWKFPHFTLSKKNSSRGNYLRKYSTQYWYSATEVILSNITLFSLSASGSAAAHEKKSLLTMGFIVATPRWDKGGTEEPREIVARRPVLVGPFKFMEEV